MEEDKSQTRPRNRRGSRLSASTHNSVASVDKNHNSVIVEVDIESEVSENESDKSSLYAKEKNKVSGAFTLLSVVCLVLVTLLFVKYMDQKLPQPFTAQDVQDNPKAFIEERARRDLHDLSEVGIRVSGSRNTDLLAVDILLRILDEIKLNTSSSYSVEYEEQKPYGSFWLDDDEGSTSVYAKIPNVVAKIEPSDPGKRTNSSILLNCHFDSKPGSPGATDNVISCSVMLEILRVLSTQKELLIHNTIVFLFNGAEELGLQGAHGFVQGRGSHLDTELGHPWSKNLKAFVNLEGAGAGGREILFQATGGKTGRTGWLLDAYKSIPYPYTTVLAEEAFRFGVIPSDTDFRIFRDFSQTPGMDLAFIKNGWVYHTQWDRLSEIPPGSIQHMGSNALAITEHLANLDFTEKNTSPGEMVFFDVLGGFMVVYSKTIGIVINLLVALIVLGVIMWEVGWQLTVFFIYMKYVGVTVLAWGAAVGMAALVAVILNGSGYPKPFYSYPSLAAILFGIPAILTEILVYSFCLKSSPNETWMASRFTLALVLFISTFITRAAYIFAIPLIFGLVGWFGAKYLMRGWPRGIMISYLIIGELIPLMMSSYLAITLADVFVPILGRSGSEMNGNLFFGVIIAATISVLVLSGLVALFVNYDKGILITILLVSVFLVNPMVVFGFLGKVPYQEKTPMRVTIADLDRSWYDASGSETRTQNGYWFWPLDANTIDFMPEFAKTVAEIDNVEDEILDYETCKSLYCAQPFIWPTTSRIKKTHWISKQARLPKETRDQVSMQVLENTSIGDPGEGRRRISLRFFGPTQMTVVLSPAANWKEDISIKILGSPKPVAEPGNIQWKGRNVYFIYYGTGYESEPLDVSLELTKDGEGSQTDDSILEIQLTGLFLHQRETLTPDFVDFMSRFPSWAYTGMSWAAVMKMYTL